MGIKVGLVGCGGMGKSHLDSFIELKKAGIEFFDLVAVCDVLKGRALSFAGEMAKYQELKPKVYTDFKDMLKDVELDAVDIATDHRSHHVIGVSCLEAGAHALIEKPLAITIKACRKLIEAADKAGRVLAVAENYRRDMRWRAVKFLVDQGYVGPVQMVFVGGVGGSVGWGRDYITVGTSWRHVKLKAGAGPVLDNGVHDADLFRYIVGDVEEVYGVTKTFAKSRVSRDRLWRVMEKVEASVEDAGFAILKFNNGAVGFWAPAYWAGHGEASSFGWWIYGGKGVVKGDEAILDNGERVKVQTMFLAQADEEVKGAMFPHGFTNPVTIEIYDFLDSILSKRKPETDGVEGLKAEAIAYAAIESSILNQPVKVKDVEEGRIDNYQREIDQSLGL